MLFNPHAKRKCSVLSLAFPYSHFTGSLWKYQSLAIDIKCCYWYPQRLIKEGHIGCLAKRHKNFLEPKKPNSMARNRDRKSRYFTPAACITRQIRFPKRWEKWEEELFSSLRAEGKTYGQISQRLPGRTEGACKWRAYQKLKIRTVPKPNRDKRWEDWEDQLILEHRKAGERLSKISELLSHRTASALRNRWYRVLKHRTEATIAAPIATGSQHRRTLGEGQLLKSLRESGQSWTEIAKTFPDRTVTQCSRYWYRILHPPRNQQWKEWEERLLVSGYYAGLSWKEIAKSIPERTSIGAMQHWYQHLCLPGQDKPWTSEELTILTQLRAEGNGWDEISQEIPRHNSNACRTQWYKETEGLKGSSHRTLNERWSAEETNTLIALYNTIGPRWQEICKHVPGRTARACQTHLYQECTQEDGVGDAPSEYWIDYFESK